MEINRKEFGKMQFRSGFGPFLKVFEQLRESIQAEHREIMKKTPFWGLFKAYDDGLVSDDMCRKTYVDIIRVISCFNVGTTDFIICGRHDKVLDGSRQLNSKNKCGFITRNFNKKNSVSRQDIEAAIYKVVERRSQESREDFVCLLCLHFCVTLLFCTSGNKISWNLISHCQNVRTMQTYNWAKATSDYLEKQLVKHSERPKSVSGCVAALLFWFCEKIPFIEPLRDRSDVHTKFVQWDLHKLHAAIENVDLTTDTVQMKSKKEKEDVSPGTLTWVIDNFSKLKNYNHYSDVFVVGGFKWQILIWFTENKVNREKQLSMYLGVADASSLPQGWTRSAQFSFSVVNQLASKKSIRKSTMGTLKEFKASKSEWGFKSFMPLSELYDQKAGYLVNDTCIVEAKVDVPTDQGSSTYATMKSAKEEQKGDELSNVNSVQAADSSPSLMTPSSEPVPPYQVTPGSEKVSPMPTDDGHTDPPQVKELGEVPTNLSGELMEFRGLGKIEKAFVPLLEEVCSLHPSLIESLHKRNRKVIECALTTIGELLHFLKTTKVKDMTEDACVRLQSLWEDVTIFSFDLAWLEPHVQSALGKKKLLGRARRVKRLRQDVDVLDCVKKRRSAALAIAEADLEVAKRNLAKEEDGFVEIDMDSELGYGMR